MKKNLYLLFFIVFTLGNTLNSYAQKATSNIITTIAGSGISGYSGNGGPATLAKLDAPTCIARDAYGNLFINDQVNNCVRKVDAAGIITTIAGTGAKGFGGDGNSAVAAKLHLNAGVAIDNADNIYITDEVNNRVRKVNNTGIISTIAGNGSASFSGDNGPAVGATFDLPLGIAVDRFGNVFISDMNNFRVRKINAAGIVSTVAGNGLSGFMGNNVPATSARLSYTFGLTVDGTGNLYICDGGNNCIRKVDPAGMITTIAGTGTAGYTGDNGPATAATLNQPEGVFVHTSGEIYIADFKNNCIRKIDLAGTITTVVGTGASGYNGDGIEATAAKLSNPISVILDNNDNIYVADIGNVRVRKISKVSTLSFTLGRRQQLNLCKNAADTAINGLLEIIDYQPGASDTWKLLVPPAHGIASGSYVTPAKGIKDIPAGFNYMPQNEYIGSDSFVVVVDNGTLSDTTTIYVTVSAIPSAGEIIADARVCAGSSITVSATSVGGLWSLSNQHASVKGDIITGTLPGLVTVTYTVANLCGSNTVSKEIIVDPLPNAGVLTGPHAFCNGSTITLTANQAGGEWASSNDLASVDGGTVTGIYPGIAYIKYTVKDSFCSASVSHKIIIDTFPYAGIIIGPTGVCLGSDIVLANAVNGGSWLSSSPSAAIATTSSAPVNATIAGLEVGVSTISYNIVNSCGIASSVKTLTVEPLPVIPTITRRDDTCTVTHGYSSYQWTLDGKAIPGATNEAYNVSATGNYAVVVKNKNGCSSTSQPMIFSGCAVSEMHIFPNPANSLVYIQWCKKIRISLMCIDGREIKTIENSNVLDLGGIANGAYILNVYDTDGNKLKTERITRID